MKKKLLFFASFVLILVALFALGSSSAYASEYKMGDVNMDGAVNTRDVVLVKQSIVGMIDLTDEQKAYADVYDDGTNTVNTRDVVLMLQHIVGMDVELGHTHVMIKTNRKDATCTEDGNIEYWSCSTCGKHYADPDGVREITLSEAVIVASHSLTHHETKSASCTEDGNIEYWSCAACNKNYSDADANTEVATVVVDASHNLTHHNAESATCTEDGNIEYWSCSACNQNFSDINATAEVTNTVIAASHSLTHHEAKVATCTEDGNIEYWSCTACNKNYSDANAITEIEVSNTVIVASHSLTHHEAKIATCTEEGNIEYYTCSCGKWFTNHTATAEITDKDSVVIEKDEHEYTELKKTNTQHWYECSCGDKSCVENHKGGIASCTELAECQVCDEEYGNLSNHNFIEKRIEQDYLVSKATCVSRAVYFYSCICGEKGEDVYEVGEFAEHVWEEVKCGEKRKCKKCNLVSEEVIEHEWSEGFITIQATCSGNGVMTYICTNCLDKKMESIPMLAHAYSIQTEIKKPTCIEEGVVSSICSKCGNTVISYIDKTEHVYSNEWVIDEEATCIKKGQKSYHCLNCDNKKDITIIEARGHVEMLDNPVAATCNKEGKTAGSHCSVCEIVIIPQETISKLSHSYGSWITSKQPTNLETGSEYRTCSKCGSRENRTIEKITAVKVTVTVSTQDYIKNYFNTKPYVSKILITENGSGYDVAITVSWNLKKLLIMRCISKMKGGASYDSEVDCLSGGSYSRTIKFENVSSGTKTVTIQLRDYLYAGGTYS